jgi:nucleotide-binding universal stress UspA family protein
VEDTSGAHACLGEAASIARQFGATLTVLAALPPGTRQSAAQATTELCSTIPEAVSRQCTVQPSVRRGQTAEQILRFARDGKQDLIVLGAQSRRGLRSMFFAETADVVLRHAQTPVLVIPVPAGD